MNVMFYVYTHSTDDGIVFNVGKGKDGRAWCRRRSVKWNRVVEKYGLNVSIVWETESEIEALAYEIQLISHFETFTREFGDDNIFCNFTLGGEGGLLAGRSGPSPSLASRAKMSAAKKGKPSRNKGRSHSPEAKAKMSAAKRGKPASNKGKSATFAARINMSAAKKGRPALNKGKLHSPESRAKMSISAKRRWSKYHLLEQLNERP